MSKKDNVELQDVDVLEQVKRVEKAIKAKMLIEKIAQLKQHAREINELKEKSVATLEALDLSDKDIKRVIDYINELPDVKLSEKDKKAIRDSVSEDVVEEKVEQEKQIREINIEKFFKDYPRIEYKVTNEPYLINGIGTLKTALDDDVMLNKHVYMCNVGMSNDFTFRLGSGDGFVEFKL